MGWSDCVWSRLEEAQRQSPSRSAFCEMGRGDVLVETKDVLWVVDILERDETPVGVRRVGGLDAVRALDAEVIDVNAGGVRLYRPEEITRPRHVSVGLGGVFPDGEDGEVKHRVAVAEAASSARPRLMAPPRCWK